MEKHIEKLLKMMQAFMPHVSQSELKIMADISSRMGSIADNTSGGSYSYRSLVKPL